MSSPLADHFARFASSYDRVNHVLSLGLDVRWRARLLRAIEPRPALRILDLCAGTLTCTRGVLQRFADARVTAVDFCREMLDIGLAQMPPSLRPRLNTVCGDVLQLDFERGSFDVAICSWAMRHLTQQEIILQNIHSWLSPGGQLVIFDFFRPSTVLSKLFHATAGRYLLPAAGKVLKGFGPAYLHLHASIDRFASREEYEKLLLSQRFAIHRSEDLTFGIVSLIVAEPLPRDAPLRENSVRTKGENHPHDRGADCGRGA